jgi:NCS2 family nucleobase:cation symporter-2
MRTELRLPPGMIYGVNDSPPQVVTLLNGFQHVGLIAIYLVYPLLVFRLAGTAPDVIANLLSIGMLVVGIGTFLQVLRLGPLGSGYMCPTTFTATYLSPSLLAATTGGLPLVFGRRCSRACWRRHWCRCCSACVRSFRRRSPGW